MKEALLKRAADNIRVLTAAMVEKAKSGHPGGAMGGADFVNALFSSVIVFDPEDGGWIARDRFLIQVTCHRCFTVSLLSVANIRWKT